MGMGGFAEGMDDGLKTYLNNQQNQEGMAFRLKLQNAQIEGQLANEQKMAEFNKASANVTGEIFKDSGMQAKPGQRESVAALGLLAGKQRAAMMSASRLAQGASRGMTVADFEDARGVKTGWKSDRWLNPYELRTWEARLKSETPTAEVMNSYKQQMSGFKLIDQLQQLRTDALAEVLTGPMKGRVSNLALAAEQGDLFPKAAAYMKFAKAQLANVAHFSGEVGRLAEGDIDRAGELVSDFKVANATSDILFNASRESARNSMKTSEELFPQLRRMRETEAANMGLKSKAAADAVNEHRKLSRSGFDKFKAAREADEAAKKNTR